MMKRIALFLILACFAEVPFVYSQNPVCQWSSVNGGVLSEQTGDIATDAQGNVIVCGSFESDSIQFGNQVLYNSYFVGSDVFIVKYSPTGSVLWARQGEGNLDEYATGITIDDAGNVIVTGYFRGQYISFDSIGLTNSGLADPEIFIVKYDPAGNVIWANSAGGVNYDYGRSVASDASGNIFLTGYFESPSITIGPFVLTNPNSIGAYSDMFLAKYDPNGNVLWAVNTQSLNSDVGFGVAVDTTGNVYVTGFFSGSSISFGNIVLTNPLPTGGPMFLVKYDTWGNALWAKCSGGVPISMGWDVTTDPANNVAVCGSFFDGGNVTFGPHVLTSQGGHDMFLVKYDSSGNELWAQSAGGTAEDIAFGVASDPAGNFLVCGHFQSDTMYTASSTLYNQSTGYEKDMFMVKLSGSGGFLWSQGLGGADEDYGAAVASDPDGYNYITGFFASPSFSSGTCTVNNSGNLDMMVMKFADNQTSFPEEDFNNQIILFPNPGNGEINIVLNGIEGSMINDDIIVAEIFNSFGALIFKDRVNRSDVSTIRLDVPDGVYHLKLSFGDTTMINRFVVAR